MSTGGTPDRQVLISVKLVADPGNAEALRLPEVGAAKAAQAIGGMARAWEETRKAQRLSDDSARASANALNQLGASSLTALSGITQLARAYALYTGSQNDNLRTVIQLLLNTESLVSVTRGSIEVVLAAASAYRSLAAAKSAATLAGAGLPLALPVAAGAAGALVLGGIAYGTNIGGFGTSVNEAVDYLSGSQAARFGQQDQRRQLLDQQRNEVDRRRIALSQFDARSQQRAFELSLLEDAQQSREGRLSALGDARDLSLQRAQQLRNANPLVPDIGNAQDDRALSLQKERLTLIQEEYQEVQQIGELRKAAAQDEKNAAQQALDLTKERFKSIKERFADYAEANPAQAKLAIDAAKAVQQGQPLTREQREALNISGARAAFSGAPGFEANLEKLTDTRLASFDAGRELLAQADQQTNEAQRKFIKAANSFERIVDEIAKVVDRVFGQAKNIHINVKRMEDAIEAVRQGGDPQSRARDAS